MGLRAEHLSKGGNDAGIGAPRFSDAAWQQRHPGARLAALARWGTPSFGVPSVVHAARDQAEARTRSGACHEAIRCPAWSCRRTLRWRSDRTHRWSGRRASACATVRQGSAGVRSGSTRASAQPSGATHAEDRAAVGVMRNHASVALTVERPIRNRQVPRSNRGGGFVAGRSQVWKGTGFGNRHAEVRILPPRLVQRGGGGVDDDTRAAGKSGPARGRDIAPWAAARYPQAGSIPARHQPIPTRAAA